MKEGTFVLVRDDHWFRPSTYRVGVIDSLCESSEMATVRVLNCRGPKGLNWIRSDPVSVGLDRIVVVGRIAQVVESDFFADLIVAIGRHLPRRVGEQ
jgi:hypothetical protein